MRTKLLRSGLGFFAFAAGISLVNVLVFPYARENYGYGLIGLWLAYAAALALLTLAGRAVSRMNADRAERAARALAPAFTLLLFAVHLLMGYLLEYTPSGDNFMLYKSSQMLATDGNFDNYPYFYLYLSRFSNQWGFTLMLTAFYKLIFALGVTQTFYPLVLVQAVLYVFSTHATLRIARRLSGAKGELMTLLMLACCLPMYVAAAVLYTDTFSVPFIMVALDLALRIKDAQSRGAQLALSAACGAVVLIGCQIKMTVLIALMAAVIVWLLEMKPGRAMLCTALCAAIVGGGTAAVQHYMKNEVLDPEMVAQHHTPAIHWVMMSIPSGNNPYGGFSGDYAITWGMMEEGATHEEVMASIYSRMKDKIYTLRYPNRLISAALRKDSAFMGDGTYGMTEMLDDGPVRENVVSSFVLEGRSRYRLHMTLCTGVWLAQLTLALIACVRDIRRSDPASGAKAGSLRYMTLYVAFFGAALFLMLWEARGRYLFGFVAVLLLLAARDAALRQKFIDRAYTLAHHPDMLLSSLSRKNLSTFGRGTFELNEIFEADEHEPNNALKQVVFAQGRWNRAYTHLATALFLAQMLLACMACAQAVHRRDTSAAPLFLTLLGAFLFLCIWETRARYFFQFMMVLLCAGAMFDSKRAD